MKQFHEMTDDEFHVELESACFDALYYTPLYEEQLNYLDQNGFLEEADRRGYNVETHLQNIQYEIVMEEKHYH